MGCRHQCLTIYTNNNWQVSSFKLDPWNKAKQSYFCIKYTYSKHILLVGKMIIRYSQCSNLNWYLPFQFLEKENLKIIYIGFHLNYAAIFKCYCPRSCLMRISVIKSSTVFHNYKNDNHQQKDSCSQSHDGFYFASTPPHLPSKLFGSVAESSCIIR